MGIVEMFFFVENLVFPLAMIIIGFVIQKSLPKMDIDHLSFRSKLAVRSHDTWLFAQRYFSKMLRLLGGFSFGITAVLFIAFFPYFSEHTLLTTLLHCAALICSCCCTDIALKKGFTAEGEVKLPVGGVGGRY